MASILIVEDDETLGLTLESALKKEGYLVTLASSKNQAQKLLEASERFDLALLDVGLPDGSGLDLARELRLKSEMGIVMLSAMTSAEFRLEGFENGADDYIPKPFHLKELVLRIRKVLESKNRKAITSFSGFKLDQDGKIIEFTNGDKVFPLERDFQLLKYLISQSPRGVSREELLEKFWKSEAGQTGRTVDNAIVRLRQHLGDYQKNIRSVRGVGYQWV